MRGQKKKKEIYDACTLLVSMDRYFAAEIALPGMILGTYLVHQYDTKSTSTLFLPSIHYTTINVHINQSDRR